jgi:glycosyltransferase involved in cell wall biosynthesis
MMHTLPTLTVSVIIPVHNGGEKFLRCLSSVKALMTAPSEVIVVLGGESGNTDKVVKEFDVKVLKNLYRKVRPWQEIWVHSMLEEKSCSS